MFKFPIVLLTVPGISYANQLANCTLLGPSKANEIYFIICCHLKRYCDICQKRNHLFAMTFGLEFYIAIGTVYIVGLCKYPGFNLFRPKA